MTNIEITNLINRSYLCLANKTTALVSKLNLGLECNNVDYTCLYSFILDLYIISKWNQYPDGSTYNLTNCITQDQFNKIVENLKEKLVDCNTNVNTGVVLANDIKVLDFLQDNFNYIKV